MGIKLLNYSPYYAQANGQEEASNKIMIKIIQKKIDQKPKRWHSVLNEACGLTEWPLMALHTHLIIVGLWTSCCLAMGDAVRLKESSIAKGFKFQGLQ
jgi:hypothetical protein